MPRGRMLNKEISDSRKLPMLSNDTYRLIYTWLLPWLDIEGRFSANPEVIKGHIVPRIKRISSSVIDKALIEMHDVGLITLYQIDGDRYLQYKKFKEHQNLNLERETPSRIPGPEKGEIIPNSGCTPEQVGTNSLPSHLKISKVKLSKDNIGVPEGTPTFFTMVKNYFTTSYKKKFGKIPAIDFGKDGRVVRQKETLFLPLEEAYELIDLFLDSEKAKECGYTLSVCFSSHTINQWRAGELGGKRLSEDELFEKHQAEVRKNKK